MVWHGIGETMVVLIDEHDIPSSYFLRHHESTAADQLNTDKTPNRHGDTHTTAISGPRRPVSHRWVLFPSLSLRPRQNTKLRSLHGRPATTRTQESCLLDALGQPTVAPTQSQINTDDTRHSESKHKQGRGENTHRLDTNNIIALQRGSAYVQPAKSVFFLLVLSWVGRGWIYM